MEISDEENNLVSSEPIKDTVSDNDLDAILNQYNTKVIEGENIIEETTNEFSQETAKKKRGRPKGGKNKASSELENNIIDSQLLTGSLLILLIDLLFPLVITTLNNMFNKKTKIDSEDLMLTEKQKKDLVPIADQVARKINIDNPLLLMVICLGGIYGINYTTAITIKKSANEKDTN